MANHHSGSYPAALRRYGVFGGRRRSAWAVLRLPTSVATLTNVFPDCQPYRESAALARFVLADEVAATASRHRPQRPAPARAAAQRGGTQRGG